MAANLYEIHITVDKKDWLVATKIAKDLHWKTSQIDGDPVLGSKPFFYLTQHVRGFEIFVAHYARSCMADSLREANIEIIREKIEQILFDTKGSV